MNSRAALARGLQDDSSRTPSRVVDIPATHPTIDVTLRGKDFDSPSLRRPSVAASLSPAIGRRLSLADGWPAPSLPGAR